MTEPAARPKLELWLAAFVGFYRPGVDERRGLDAVSKFLFWGLVILAFAALLRWLGGGSIGETRAIDILKARYARGELTREQFEHLKRELAD